MHTLKNNNDSNPEIPAYARIKICGMKYNTQEVAALQPDYLGFIFYEKSKRDFGELAIPTLPDGIQKVGVFVDADLAFAKAKIIQHKLDVVQLHGSESPEYIDALRLRSGLVKYEKKPEHSRRVKEQTSNKSTIQTPSKVEVPAQSKVEVPAPSKVEFPAQSKVEVWKVFGIKDHFDFEKLQPYEGLVDAFLFDTKGKEKGGNGYTFDWSVLKNYTSKTPIVLSGGISLEEVEKVKEILATDLPIIALDVNSRFEKEPGLKDIEKLKKFMNALNISPNPSLKRGI